MNTGLKILGSAALVALSALPFTAGSASALPIAGTTSFTSSDTNGVVLVSNLLSTFSFPLNIGGSIAQNLLTLTPDPGNGTHTYDFTVTDTIAFTGPGSGSFAEVGTATFHVQGNIINSGSLTWADGASGINVTLSNGSVVNVNLGDVTSFSGSASSGNSQTVSATFTLVSSPATAAPEPASMLVLGAGMLGLGVVRRVRR